ncbi:MAG: ATP-grasp domain-containing protein [Candidatus Taylorbacteria bacterium]|nr:ATP-grasp domain-containing protein [Candidatus Taylorbacteria bacterium]
MDSLSKIIKAHPLVYVTRDIERATGLEPGNGYYIITNKTPYSEKIQAEFPENVILINNPEILDTHELLSHADSRPILEMAKKKNGYILVFKNTKKIEEICKENGWKILNPSAELSEKVENKISQIEWLGELSSILPAFEVKKASEIVWKKGKQKMIVQWGRGHTGDSTVLINSKKELATLQAKFPERMAKVTEFINGPVFTSNITVGKDKILYGNISYQITGLLPYTDSPFATIGNDWSLTHSLLTERLLEQYEGIATKVAEKMQKDGWLGLFGIDVIYDTEKETLYLLEINARQPASTTFESELQTENSTFGVTGSTIFETHLFALLGLPMPEKIIEINDGSQIIQRATESLSKKFEEMSKKEHFDFIKFEAKKVESAEFRVIDYINTAHNADLLRIQCSRGIMETHNKLNERGLRISELLSDF